MVRTKWPRFFLICHAVHADAASRAGRYSTGTGDRRAGRALPPPPPSPSGGRGKALFPGIQPVGADPQLFGDHFRGLAAGQPLINGFAFERFIEFTAGLNGCLCHGLVGSLSTQSSVRQFEATRLQKEANTTLTFLYVVISASFSAAVKLFIGPGSIVLAISLALLCFYLACLAAYLVLDRKSVV